LWFFGFVCGWVCLVLILKTPGFLLSPILQHVRIADPRQNVLMKASSVHGMSSKKTKKSFQDGLIKGHQPVKMEASDFS